MLSMQPTARSLILDLLSTLRKGSMPVRALVEAGALLGIEENNIRVSLARLYASGRVERDERGRYRLGQAVAAMSQRLRSWRDLDTRAGEWKGDWIAVHRATLGRGPARRRCEKAFELLGFRELEPGLAIRPNNLQGGVDAVRAQLIALALGPVSDANASSGRDGGQTAVGRGLLGRVFLSSRFDPTSDLEARSLWDADALAEQTRAESLALQASVKRLPALSAEDAMTETFLVGGRALRFLTRHPLLPEEILAPEPLAALLEQMRDYDRSGRDAWAAFLARHDVPHRALPLDSSSAPHEVGPTSPDRPIGENA
jgi:phenylacetic acid degradation operon negative regulatory protein